MTPQTAMTIRPPRAAWLEERKTGIGASEVAAILGADPRRGALAIYASKVADIETKDTPWLRWGRHVEGAIALGYAEETKRPVQDLGAFEIQRHPDIPWLFATLDRTTSGSDAHPAPEGTAVPSLMVPLEIKAVGFQKRAQWEEEPPLEYVIQLQAQLSCTGAAWGSLCALIGGLTIAWKDLPRNDDFLSAAYPKLEEFWMRVQRREPPDADGLPGTSAAVRKLWAAEDGETVPLDADALALVTAWESEKASSNAADGKAGTLENQIRQRLGTATFGALPDGSFVSLKLQKRGAHAVKATEFRVLRRWHPKVRGGRK